MSKCTTTHFCDAESRTLFKTVQSGPNCQYKSIDQVLKNDEPVPCAVKVCDEGTITRYSQQGAAIPTNRPCTTKFCFRKQLYTIDNTSALPQAISSGTPCNTSLCKDKMLTEYDREGVPSIIGPCATIACNEENQLEIEYDINGSIIRVLGSCPLKPSPQYNPYRTQNNPYQPCNECVRNRAAEYDVAGVGRSTFG